MLKNRFFLCILTLGILTVNAYAQQNWYHFLPPNQKYAADYDLAPLEIQTVTIETDKKKIVGFWTDTPNITDAQVAKYSTKMPIMFKQKGKEKEIRSLFGSGLICSPVNGKIEVIITNESNENFKIVIWSQVMPKMK